MESSRERTARSMGKMVSRKARPSGEVMVIWVEAWSSTSGTDGAGHFRETEILNDEGIDSGGGDEAELLFRCLQLAGEDEGVHGDEAFDAVLVEVVHELGEIFLGEIVGAKAGVEFRQTEVDGIGTGGDGGACAVPVSGG